MAKFVTLIAGNICAGKTSKVNYINTHKEQFQQFLTKDETLIVIPEYIDPPARRVFYRNRQDNSIFFEYSCLINRINRHLDVRGEIHKKDNNLYFFDRGIIEAVETFTRNSYEEGFMTLNQFNQYKDIVKEGLQIIGKDYQQQHWLEQLIVYLEVKDEYILQDRYKQRSSTTEEEPIPLDYFKRINERYHFFFENITSIYNSYNINPPQVLRIDASINGNHNNGYQQQTIDLIIAKMKEMNIK